MRKVAIGPSTSDSRHQTSPLLPLPWASPALIRASVPQPAKKLVRSSIGISLRGPGTPHHMVRSRSKHSVPSEHHRKPRGRRPGSSLGAGGVWMRPGPGFKQAFDFAIPAANGFVEAERGRRPCGAAREVPPKTSPPPVPGFRFAIGTVSNSFIASHLVGGTSFESQIVSGTEATPGKTMLTLGIFSTGTSLIPDIDPMANFDGFRPSGTRRCSPSRAARASRASTQPGCRGTWRSGSARNPTRCSCRSRAVCRSSRWVASSPPAGPCETESGRGWAA